MAENALDIIDQHLTHYQRKSSQLYKYEINALEAVKEDIKGELEDE